MRQDARALWSKRVERWKDSGLSAKEFARELGINANTLAHWGWKLKERRGQPCRKPPRVEPAIQFVEVVPPALVQTSASAPAEPLEVVLREGVRIRVPVHFDDGQLRRVIAVLAREAS